MPVGIEFGCDEIEGCKVGLPGGHVEIEWLCKVPIDNKLGCSLGKDKGTILLVGLKLGLSNRAVLIDQFCDGLRLGMVEINGKSVGAKLGAVLVNGPRERWRLSFVESDGKSVVPRLVLMILRVQ